MTDSCDNCETRYDDILDVAYDDLIFCSPECMYAFFTGDEIDFGEYD